MSIFFKKDEKASRPRWVRWFEELKIGGQIEQEGKKFNTYSNLAHRLPRGGSAVAAANAARPEVGQCDRTSGCIVHRWWYDDNVSLLRLVWRSMVIYETSGRSFLVDLA